MKLVTFKVCINSKMTECLGVVVGERETDYLVDFEHDGVGFRGWWPKGDCR
jgi:hypothetical protein